MEQNPSREATVTQLVASRGSLQPNDHKLHSLDTFQQVRLAAIWEMFCTRPEQEMAV